MTAGSLATAKPQEASTDWWHDGFRVFQTNLREVDAGLDVERTLDFIEDFGASTWLINAGGILSFFPTRLDHQRRNPHLADRPSGDLLGDAIEAAHRRGVRVIARMDFSKVHRSIAEAHPDWVFEAPDGSWQVLHDLVSTCPAADYYQEKVFEALDEVITGYRPDGFFFNSFGFNEIDYAGRYRGVSQSRASRESFRAAAGMVLPTGPEDAGYPAWKRWSQQVVTDLAARIRTHIKARDPRCALILRQSSDVTFDEANNEVGRELWHLQTSESASALATAEPEVPVMVNSVAFLDMPYRLAGEEPEHFAQYLVQAISRGANPSTYIMGTPGDIPYPSLEPARDVTRFHRRWSDLYRDARPAASVALLRADRFANHGQRLDEARAEFRGAYSALQEAHVPFDVVSLETLCDTDQLAPYRHIVAPDIGAIADSARNALNGWLGSGGGLLLTGRSGFDEAGAPLWPQLPATRWRRSESDADALKSSYVSREAPTVSDSGPERVLAPIAPVYGTWLDVEPREDSSRLWHHLPHARYGPPEKAYGHREDGTAGILVSDRRGVALVPWTAGRAYYELGLTSIRDYILEAFTTIRGLEPIDIDAPEHVEATVMRSGPRLMVHLNNLSGRRRTTFRLPVPVYEASIRLRGHGSRPVHARSLRTGQECAVDRDAAGDPVIGLPGFARFDVIVLDDAEEIPV